jgi:hypothetical protein
MDCSCRHGRIIDPLGSKENQLRGGKGRQSVLEDYAVKQIVGVRYSRTNFNEDWGLAIRKV